MSEICRCRRASLIKIKTTTTKKTEKTKQHHNNNNNNNQKEEKKKKKRRTEEDFFYHLTDCKAKQTHPPLPQQHLHPPICSSFFQTH